MDADNRRRRLRGSWGRRALALAATALGSPAGPRTPPLLRGLACAGWAGLILAFDPTRLAWLGLAVGAGWAGHLLGDCCTTQRWEILAPLTWRKFGGWKFIPPIDDDDRSRRVTWQERMFEIALWWANAAALVVLLGQVPAVTRLAHATLEAL
jgi:hypothetical protein